MMEKQREREGKNKGRDGVERDREEKKKAEERKEERKKEEAREDSDLGLHTERDGRSSVCGECIFLWLESKAELSQESWARI